MRTYPNITYIFVNGETDEKLKAIRETPHDAIIVITTCPKEPGINLLKKHTKCKHLYYVHHGFGEMDFRNFSKQLVHFIGSTHGFHSMSKSHPGKVRHIPGLPQTDFILNNKELILTSKKQEIYQKYNIDPNKKLILIVPFTAKKYKKSIEITNTCMKMTLDALNQSCISKNYQILLKTKDKSYNAPKNNIGRLWQYENREFSGRKRLFPTPKPSFIIYLEPNTSLYDYLGADLILIIEGGSAFFESLLVNPSKTIMVQCKGSDPRYQKAQNIPNLMISQNTSQLVSYINQVITNNSTRPSKGANTYINNVIGKPCSPVSQLIIDSILNDLD